MGTTASLGEQRGFAECEPWIRKRQPGYRFVHVASQPIPPLGEHHDDARRPQHAQVAIEAADVAAESLSQHFTRLRTFAEEAKQAIQVWRPLSRYRLEGQFAAGCL